jgi:hypothetical protein
MVAFSMLISVRIMVKQALTQSPSDDAVSHWLNICAYRPLVGSNAVTDLTAATVIYLRFRTELLKTPDPGGILTEGRAAPGTRCQLTK